MTRLPTENDHLPIYEDLVRERGDAVAEARTAAEHLMSQGAPSPPHPPAGGGAGYGAGGPSGAHMTVP